MIESASAAIGTGIGAALTAAVYLGVKLFRRNGPTKSEVSAEGIRRELHDRMNNETATIKQDYVRKEVCKLVSEGLQRDMAGIKKGVDTLLERSQRE